MILTKVIKKRKIEQKKRAFSGSLANTIAQFCISIPKIVVFKGNPGR